MVTINSDTALYQKFLFAPDELGRSRRGPLDHMCIRRNDSSCNEKSTTQAHRLPL